MRPWWSAALPSQAGPLSSYAMRFLVSPLFLSDCLGLAPPLSREPFRYDDQDTIVITRWTGSNLMRPLVGLWRVKMWLTPLQHALSW